MENNKFAKYISGSPSSEEHCFMSHIEVLSMLFDFFTFESIITLLRKGVLPPTQVVVPSMLPIFTIKCALKYLL